MALAATIFLGLMALLHVYIFVLESVRWRHPSVWTIFGIATQADADTTAPLAYNQGFYNLFLAIGAAIGLVLYNSVAHEAGFALALFCGAAVTGAAIVLLSTGRRNLRSGSLQGVPALVGVVLLLIAG